MENRKQKEENEMEIDLVSLFFYLIDKWKLLFLGAVVGLVPMQPGDVPVTYADTSALERDFGFKPSTSLREGLRRFAEWYKEFYL